MSRPCTRCTKAVFPLDDKISAEGGIWHKSCFKCTQCGGQLTLLSFAQIKGTLYCKPHFIELFKRRGKYDDLTVGHGKDDAPAHETSKPGDAHASREAAKPAEGPKAEDVSAHTETHTRTHEEKPAEAAPAPAASESTNTTAQESEAASETFISGLSVKERIAAHAAAHPVVSESAQKDKDAPKERRASATCAAASSSRRASEEAAKEAPAPAPAAVVEVAEPAKPAASEAESASTHTDKPASAPVAAVHASDKPAETFITGLSVKERIALAAAGKSAAASDSPAPAPAAAALATHVHDSPTADPVVTSPPLAAPAPAPAPAPMSEPTKPATSSDKKPAKVLGLGGGASKCASCGKSVYPADPQIGNDGSVWHRECFKCSHCKGQLTVKGMAVFEGQLFCKPHFVALFKLKGKYDTLKAGDAATGDGKADDTNGAAADAVSPPVSSAPAVTAE